MSGFFSGLGALGKIAGLLSKVAAIFNNMQQQEAGRNDERARIADQEAHNHEKVRKARGSVRSSADADRVFDARLKNGREE